MSTAADPVLKTYTQALEALHKKGWAKAAKLFESVIESTDLPEVRARALQYLAACRQHLDEKGASDAPDDDPFLQALFEKNRGNLAAALEACRQGGRDQKDERFAYLAASIHASEGRTDEAAKVLARAIELNSKNRIHAFHDSDFAELRGNPNHRQLFGLS
jgi:tetratricopeptide (TPR) repeat protein